MPQLRQRKKAAPAKAGGANPLGVMLKVLHAKTSLKSKLVEEEEAWPYVDVRSVALAGEQQRRTILGSCNLRSGEWYRWCRMKPTPRAASGGANRKPLPRFAGKGRTRRQSWFKGSRLRKGDSGQVAPALPVFRGPPQGTSLKSGRAVAARKRQLMTDKGIGVPADAVHTGLSRDPSEVEARWRRDHRDATRGPARASKRVVALSTASALSVNHDSYARRGVVTRRWKCRSLIHKTAVGERLDEMYKRRLPDPKMEPEWAAEQVCVGDAFAEHIAARLEAAEGKAYDCDRPGCPFVGSYEEVLNHQETCTFGAKNEKRGTYHSPRVHKEPSPRQSLKAGGRREMPIYHRYSVRSPK